MSYGCRKSAGRRLLSLKAFLKDMMFESDSCVARTTCLSQAFDCLRRSGSGLAVLAVAALHRLPAVAPLRHALGSDDLALHVEPADEEVVALVLQVLEHERVSWPIRIAWDGS